MIEREACGCAHDGRAWKVLCPAHLAEFQERHARAAREKARADLLGWYSVDNYCDESSSNTPNEN